MSRLPIARGHLPRPGSGAWLASRSDGARLHAGVDLVAPAGTPVLAPEDGVIDTIAEASRPTEQRRSVPAGWSGYGPRVIVLHGRSDTWHVLAHLGTVDVEPGAHVVEGAQLGTVGVTSTPHLHWEVRTKRQPPRNVAIVEVCGDPAAWLRGEWVPWDGRCPSTPADDVRTPRCCRPHWIGPAPDPFPRPARLRASHAGRPNT